MNKKPNIIILLKVLIKIVSVTIVIILVTVIAGYYFGHVRLPVVQDNQNVPSEDVVNVVQSLVDLKNSNASLEEKLAYLLDQKDKIELTGQLNYQDEAVLAFYEASFLERSDIEASLEIYYRLFSDEKYKGVGWLRDKVLFEVMLLATEIGTPRLTIDQAKKLLFSPERFGPFVGINSANDIENIEDIEDVKELASIGLRLISKRLDGSEKLSALTEMDIMRSSVLLSEIHKIDPSVPFKRDVVQNRFETSLSEQEKLNILAQSIDSNFLYAKKMIAESESYSVNIVYSLNFLQKLYIDLYFAGLDTSTQIKEVRKVLNAYVSQYDDGSLFAQNRSRLISATADMFYACSLVIESDYVLNSETEVEIKENLKTILTLPKEEAQKHGSPLAEYAGNPHYSCYEAFILIGNEVDSNFKKFLINDIGGWSNSHFGG